jgi:hypothetical protein
VFGQYIFGKSCHHHMMHINPILGYPH